MGLKSTSMFFEFYKEPQRNLLGHFQEEKSELVIAFSNFLKLPFSVEIYYLDVLGPDLGEACLVPYPCCMFSRHKKDGVVKNTEPSIRTKVLNRVLLGELPELLFSTELGIEELEKMILDHERKHRKEEEEFARYYLETCPYLKFLQLSNKCK